MGTEIHIETFRGHGKQPFYYRVAASNGQTLSTSEGYSRAWNRNRAVKKLAKLMPGIEIRPV